MRAIARAARVVALVALGIFLLGVVASAEDAAAPGRRVNIHALVIRIQPEDAKNVGLSWPGGAFVAVGNFMAPLQPLFGDRVTLMNSQTRSAFDDTPINLQILGLDVPLIAVAEARDGQNHIVTQQAQFLNAQTEVVVRPRVTANGQIALSLGWCTGLVPWPGREPTKDFGRQPLTRPIIMNKGESVALVGLVNGGTEDGSELILLITPRFPEDEPVLPPGFVVPGTQGH